MAILGRKSDFLSSRSKFEFWPQGSIFGHFWSKKLIFYFSRKIREYCYLGSIFGHLGSKRWIFYFLCLIRVLSSWVDFWPCLVEKVIFQIFVQKLEFRHLGLIFCQLRSKMWFFDFLVKIQMTSRSSVGHFGSKNHFRFLGQNSDFDL